MLFAILKERFPEILTIPIPEVPIGVEIAQIVSDKKLFIKFFYKVFLKIFLKK